MRLKHLNNTTTKHTEVTMSNNKQTFNHNPNQSSVDWVIGEIMKHQMTFYGTSSMPLRIIEQAKAMHKEEVKTCMSVAFLDGLRSGNENYKAPHDSWDDYYNEAFGGNNEN